MTDEELKSIFPFGAMLLDPEGGASIRVRVATGVADDADDEYFIAWRDPYRDQAFKRDLTPANDGYNAVSASGKKFFLRPLTEDNQPEF